MAKLETNMTINLDAEPSDRLKKLIRQIVRKELIDALSSLGTSDDEVRTNLDSVADVEEA